MLELNVARAEDLSYKAGSTTAPRSRASKSPRSRPRPPRTRSRQLAHRHDRFPFREVRAQWPSPPPLTTTRFTTPLSPWCRGRAACRLSVADVRDDRRRRQVVDRVEQFRELRRPAPRRRAIRRRSAAALRGSVRPSLPKSFALGADDLGVPARAEPVVQVDRHALLGLRRRPRAAAEVHQRPACCCPCQLITLTLRKCDTALPVGLSSLIWISGMPPERHAVEGQAVHRQHAVLHAEVVVAAVERLGVRLADEQVAVDVVVVVGVIDAVGGLVDRMFSTSSDGTCGRKA